MGRDRKHPAKQVPKLRPLVRLGEAALTPVWVGKKKSERPQRPLCPSPQGERRNSFYGRGNLYEVKRDAQDHSLNSNLCLCDNSLHLDSIYHDVPSTALNALILTTTLGGSCYYYHQEQMGHGEIP